MDREAPSAVSAVLYLPDMRKKGENRVRAGTSIAVRAKSSSQSMRPARSRPMPELEQLPEAGIQQRRESSRPRIQDRASARVSRREVAMSGYLGIDVAQADLVLAREGVAGSRNYPNTERGCRDLVKSIKDGTPEPVLIVLEATGGYERSIVAALGGAGLPVVVVNPRQVRDFAKATGQLAKTDQLDSHLLADFGARVKPEVRPLASEAQEELRDFLVRQEQVLQMVGAEKNRLAQAQGKKRHALRKQIKSHISFLERDMKTLDSELDEILKESDLWREEDDLLQSVPGIGKQTARILLGHLPELGTVSEGEIAKLAGLAPINRDSGTMRGKRHIAGGRSRVRSVLYMATLVATRHNPTVRGWYQKFLSRGKAKKVALIACMRKLLVVLNSMMKTKTRWLEDPSPTTA